MSRVINQIGENLMEQAGAGVEGSIAEKNISEAAKC